MAEDVAERLADNSRSKSPPRRGNDGPWRSEAKNRTGATATENDGRLEAATAANSVPEYRARRKTQDGNSVIGGSGPDSQEKITEINAAKISKMNDPLPKFTSQGDMHANLHDELDGGSNSTNLSVGLKESKPNKPKLKWTRLNRMEVGPIETTSIIMKSITGKRGLEDAMNVECSRDTEPSSQKRSNPTKLERKRERKAKDCYLLVVVLLSVCICRGFELEPIKPRIIKNQSCLNNLSQRKELLMANLYVKAEPPVDLNRNTEWFTYPGVWTTYILILFFAWLLVLSIFGCSPGMAWTIVNLAHFAVTYHFFHWKKGTPFADDQGIYNALTWWEQIDNGKQLTRNRKFLTVVPVVLYLIASHTTDYQHPMLFLNTLAAIVLVVAKFPNMHKVRIFGINADK
nr:uncharacterized protein CFP56_53788 [Quercus suber]